MFLMIPIFPFLHALGFVHEKKKEGAIFFRVSREALRKPYTTHEKKMRPKVGAFTPSSARIVKFLRFLLSRSKR